MRRNGTLNVKEHPGVSPLVGRNPDQVLRVLAARKSGTRDNRCVGLVMEGGSLRGVYSCGIAHGLCDLSVSNAFDCVIGTSAGALNALYFVSKRMEVAQSIYAENATDRRCINLLRFPNIMDARWLIKEWILKKKRFCDHAVYNGRTRVFISATNTTTGDLRWFCNLDEDRTTFERAILATAYTPIVCGQEEIIQGEPYNDGFVKAALPIKKAIDLGCTDIVVVPTRKWGYRKKPPGVLGEAYLRWRLAKYGEGYRREFPNRYKEYNQALELARDGTEGVNTLVLAPQRDGEVIGNLETRKKKVYECGSEARKLCVAKLRYALKHLG